MVIGILQEKYLLVRVNLSRSSLQTQLHFGKQVLKQSYPDKSVFRFSRMRKKLSSSELTANLLKLISAVPVPTLQEILKEPECLVGVSIQHRFNDEGILRW